MRTKGRKYGRFVALSGLKKVPGPPGSRLLFWASGWACFLLLFDKCHCSDIVGFNIDNSIAEPYTTT
jgi:hypothetical protein